MLTQTGSILTLTGCVSMLELTPLCVTMFNSCNATQIHRLCWYKTQIYKQQV